MRTRIERGPLPEGSPEPLLTLVLEAEDELESIVLEMFVRQVNARGGAWCPGYGSTNRTRYAESQGRQFTAVARLQPMATADETRREGERLSLSDQSRRGVVCSGCGTNWTQDPGDSSRCASCGGTLVVQLGALVVQLGAREP